jgi:glycosyltransferase involved in cell wall biosynthesis
LIHPDDEAYQVFSRLTDVRLRRYLGSIRSGVLITTCPSLNLASGEHVSAGVIKIGQEHLCHANHPARLQRAIQNNYQRLDAVVTLTEGDAREYKDVLGRSSTTILTIPNAIPQMRGVSTALDENVIIAVGRFVPQKGFDLLIEAFQQVVARHPNWKLKIFGSGPDKHMLQRMIAERGIQAHAFLMEPATAIEDEYARASICAVSSRWEGFPMIVVEAMSCGLPVVSFDCPSGPGEIIHHGEDGLLVEKENIGAFAHALIDLIEDPPRRKQLGRRARASVRRFGIDLIGRQWTDLIEALRSKRSRCRSAASVVC